MPFYLFGRDRQRLWQDMIDVKHRRAGLGSCVEGITEKLPCSWLIWRHHKTPVRRECLGI
jgi:hypothetical protein